MKRDRKLWKLYTERNTLFNLVSKLHSDATLMKEIPLWNVPSSETRQTGCLVLNGLSQVPAFLCCWFEFVEGKYTIL
jgi:hypothetical protein